MFNDMFSVWSNLIDFGPYFDYEGHKERQRARQRKAAIGQSPFTTLTLASDFTDLDAFKTVVDDKGLTMTVDLPGVRPDDVKVEIESNKGKDVLVVSWTRDKAPKTRRWELTSDLDASTVAASLDLGVLTIKVAKSEKSSLTRRKIEVTKTGG